jgi:hypothetical protein
LLNSDYSWLTWTFCRKAPTSGLRKPYVEVGASLREGVLPKELWRRRRSSGYHISIILTTLNCILGHKSSGDCEDLFHRRDSGLRKMEKPGGQKPIQGRRSEGCLDL